jgi:ATP-dependent Lhr-like helicase
LQQPISDLGLAWSVEQRTGDTPQSLRKKQRERLPTGLVTTPESLSLMLSYPDAQQQFRTLACVVVDEWHELIGTKRGVQTELGLARLRHWLPNLRIWGLSATIGNLEQARNVLLGPGRTGVTISGQAAKHIEIETLAPESIERFPWAGHLGTKLLPQVIAKLEQAQTTLFFTNTRSQAEIWFQALMRQRPDWLGQIALHHGSLDRELRDKCETMLKAGMLRCVVCTSSLDLGVDFSPVDQVMQIGSPKGIARLMQRAGRSGHQPGAVSRIVGVPTHAFELIEFAAARDALAARAIEAREPVRKALDVLAQHVVTVSIGGGFAEDALLAEVRSTHAYQDLTDQEWQWVLDFVGRGGESLKAYPQYRRVVAEQGRLHVASSRIARQHRMSIGTITSDGALQVRFRNGQHLGTIEEGFIGKLAPRDRFIFAGRLLELLRVREMTAWVRPAKGRKANVPRWMGGRFPLSTQLGTAVRQKMAQAVHEGRTEDETRVALPLLELQARWSRIAQPDELLIERTKTREGYQTFVYPFEGRLVHEGLAGLAAYRIAQRQPSTIGVNVNDYGMNLLSPEPIALDEAGWRTIFRTENLAADLLASLNETELSRRQFRDIARIAGLVFQGFPGSGKSNRQLQASSDLFFDVFRDFDPHNLLLDQARREVLEQQLELSRLRAALERLKMMRIVSVETQRLSPLAFPLWAEHLRPQYVSTEDWTARVARMAERLETAATRKPRGRGKHADVSVG